MAESQASDIVPRRLDYLVETGTEGTMFPSQVSQAKAEEAAGEMPIISPIFEPGDSRLLRRALAAPEGSDPSMPKPRFAIEGWFFGGSAFPREYAPIAV